MPISSIIPEDFGEVFRSGQFEDIYRNTSSDFQQLVSLSDFRDLSASFNEGIDHYNLECKTVLQKLDSYVWIDDQREKAIHVAFNEEQQIQSLLLKPFITYPESDKILTKNVYIMPIKGDWFVFWGGTNEFINYHYVYENQRYAYDLVKVQDSLSYQGAHNISENYFAFGEEIVAPADGIVIQVLDGVKDNVPGEMDPDLPEGNYVLIEHANKEYSMLAHLKKDSIKVKTGDEVREGQCIGNCGNSGNSSEPHLHFQVMDSDDLEKGNAIRIQFKDGYEPIQGDTVSN